MILCYTNKCDFDHLRTVGRDWGRVAAISIAAVFLGPLIWGDIHPVLSSIVFSGARTQYRLRPHLDERGGQPGR
jgi:hypothetical protein